MENLGFLTTGLFLASFSLIFHWQIPCFFFHWNPLGKFGVLTLMKSSVLPALICGNSTSFYNLFYNKAYTQHYILAGDKQDHVFPLPGVWPPENLSHGHEFLLDKIEKAQ